MFFVCNQMYKCRNTVYHDYNADTGYRACTFTAASRRSFSTAAADGISTRREAGSNHPGRGQGAELLHGRDRTTSPPKKGSALNSFGHAEGTTLPRGGRRAASPPAQGSAKAAQGILSGGAVRQHFASRQAGHVEPAGGIDADPDAGGGAWRSVVRAPRTAHRPQQDRTQALSARHAAGGRHGSPARRICRGALRCGLGRSAHRRRPGVRRVPAAEVPAAVFERAIPRFEST